MVDIILMKGEITTDDYISITEAVRIYGLKDPIKGEPLVQMIPMTNLKMNIYTFLNMKVIILSMHIVIYQDLKNTTVD